MYFPGLLKECRMTTLKADVSNQEDETKVQITISAELHIHVEWTFKITQTFKVLIGFISENLYV